MGVRGQLVWDDGDVWVRVTVREAADNVFARKDAQYPQLLRSRASEVTRSQGIIFMALAGVAVSVIIVAATLGSMRARLLSQWDVTTSSLPDASQESVEINWRERARESLCD